MTCALHCHKLAPGTRIAIVEKQTLPVPESAHKVGESSVEVGAHYFRKMLDLEEHLETEQIPKMGLRLFFPSGDNGAIESRLEVGGSNFPPTPSYQFDRGRLENHLADRCRQAGVTFLDGARVGGVQVGRGKRRHEVAYKRDGEEKTLAARWVVDASGRAGTLKRQFGLQKESPHHGSSAWIRIGRRVRVDDWSEDAHWQRNFSEDHPRWLSTNHLLGEGYWIWIIPLSSGSTSIGIVADESLHSLGDFNSREKMLSWIDEREPQLGAELRAHEDEIQDFCAVKRYAMECRKLYSRDRWGIVGDAGYFIDPFYSPGNDLIAIANSFLCELIARDLRGESISLRVPAYNHLFHLFYQGTANIFRDNYRLFGHHQVMPVKILWDWLLYWSITGHVVMQGRVAHLSTYFRHMPDLKRLNDLNVEMQAHFRKWAEEKPPHAVEGTIDTSKICTVMEANRALQDDLDDAAFAKRFKDNFAQLETLFWEIVDFSGVTPDTAWKRRRHPGAVEGAFREVFAVSSGKKRETADPMPVQPAGSEMAVAGGAMPA